MQNKVVTKDLKQQVNHQRSVLPLATAGCHFFLLEHIAILGHCHSRIHDVIEAGHRQCVRNCGFADSASVSRASASDGSTNAQELTRFMPAPVVVSSTTDLALRTNLRKLEDSGYGWARIADQIRRVPRPTVGAGPWNGLGFRGAEDGVLFDDTITTRRIRLGTVCFEVYQMHHRRCQWRENQRLSLNRVLQRVWWARGW
jgi:hypothetical protein